MTARPRLTLLNAAMLVVFAMLVVGLEHVVEVRALERALDTELQTQADTVNRLHVVWDAGRRQVIVANVRRDALSMPVLYVQATDSAGSVLIRSETLGPSSFPVSSERMARALRGEDWFEDVVVDGQVLRTYTGPLWVSLASGVREPAGILEVARTVDPSAGRWLPALAVGVLVTVLVAGPLALASGAVMTRSALAPLERLVGAVRGIGDARDLSVRVELESRPPPYKVVARLTAEFNSMLERLERAARRVDNVVASQRRFIADASHELRTPLTSLRGNIHLLRDDLASEATSEHVAILSDMDAEAARMGRLVRDLLMLAEADSGRHLVLDPVDLSPLVDQAVRAAQRLREEVSVGVTNTLQAPVWVRGDPDQLAQVILILLDNAVKFSPRGGQVGLHVKLEAHGARAGVILRVSDSGPGVAPDERERIFERFYRSDRARAGDGAGLGLAIARWIVDEHDGTLAVESGGGGGATFALWLPTSDAPAS